MFIREHSKNAITGLRAPPRIHSPFRSHRPVPQVPFGGAFACAHAVAGSRRCLVQQALFILFSISSFSQVSLRCPLRFFADSILQTHSQLVAVVSCRATHMHMCICICNIAISIRRWNGMPWRLVCSIDWQFEYTVKRNSFEPTYDKVFHNLELAAKFLDRKSSSHWPRSVGVFPEYLLTYPLHEHKCTNDFVSCLTQPPPPCTHGRVHASV